MDRPPFRPAGIEAVAFDLLTALIDSWSLWIAVAGDPALGRAWRGASLRRVTGAGDYRPYEDIVRAATAEMDLPPARTEALRQARPKASSPATSIHSDQESISAVRRSKATASISEGRNDGRSKGRPPARVQDPRTVIHGGIEARFRSSGCPRPGPP